MRKLIPLLAVVFAAMACNFGSAAPTDAPGILQTSVAGTLTALAPDAGTPVPPTVTAGPGASATPAGPVTTETAPSPSATVPPEDTLATCDIAYVDNDNLFCVAVGGSPQLLASGAGLFGPQISSDGQKLAYQVTVSEGVTELWVVNANPAEGAAHLLVSDAEVPNADAANINSVNNFQWLAGTHTLAFDTRYMPTGGPFGPGEYINADLWTVDADTGTIASVLPADSAGFFQVSPDGHTIAISRGQGLDLVNADGTNYRQNVLSFPSIITYSEYIYRPRPQWSADGSLFTIAIPSADPMAADSSFAVYRVSVDGTVTPLANQPGNLVFGGSISPQIAPDGQHLVYSVGQADGSGDILHMLTLVPTTDNLFDLRTGPIGLGWSPDSQHYVYAVIPPGGANGFIIGTSDATGNVLISDLNAIRSLRWLDGSNLIFIGQVGADGWSLYHQTLGADPVLLVGGLTDRADLAGK
jgi:Tol biopolymer transport system component